MLDRAKLQRAADKVALKYGLSPEEAKTIANEAHAVYEYVAQDLAPDYKRRSTCKRSTIIEVSLDAGRLEQQLREHDLMTPAMEKFFKWERGTQLDGSSHYDDLIALVGPAFPFPEYEVSGSEY